MATLKTNEIEATTGTQVTVTSDLNIGDGSPAKDLVVTGDLTADTNGTDTTLNRLSVGTPATAPGNNDVSIQGDLEVDGSASFGSMSMTGDMDVIDLNATGTVTIGDDLTLAGDGDFNGDLDVAGSLTVNGNEVVTSVTTSNILHTSSFTGGYTANGTAVTTTGYSVGNSVSISAAYQGSYYHTRVTLTHNLGSSGETGGNHIVRLRVYNNLTGNLVGDTGYIHEDDTGYLYNVTYASNYVRFDHSRGGYPADVSIWLDIYEDGS